MKNKLNLRNYMWISGIIVLLLFSYLKFDPTTFLRILIPIMFGSSFVLLGIFALTEIRKTIKEHYQRKTKNALMDIKGLRLRQDHQTLREQIESDKEILSIRQSLLGYERNHFEKCVILSSILFAVALLSTFIDFGSYLNISNMIVMIFFTFFGLYYFSEMLHAIFVALNIVKIDGIE